MLDRLSQRYPRKDLPWLLLKWSISGWWYLFFDFVFDPILYGFGVVLLYSRMQTIMENVYSTGDFIVALGEDMTANPIPYVIFFVLFIIWIIAKMIKENVNSNKSQTAIIEALNKNQTALIEALKRIEDKLGDK